jgi:hypothetical protein
VPPQNLVFIQKSAGRGGAKNRLLDTLKTLKEGSPCALHVICSEEGEFTQRCAAMGIPVTLHNLPEWRRLLGRMRFGAAIRSLAAKLPFTGAQWVISNEMWWGPHAAALARELSAKSAVILRDGIAQGRKARQYRLQDHDHILPSSQRIADNLARDPRMAQRTKVLLDAVLLPERQPQSNALLQDSMRSVSPAVRRWMLVLGRVQARKNQVDAVALLRDLINRGHEDLGLLVAGDCDADYRPLMEQAIERHGSQGRVVMLGNFSDIQALFESSFLTLLTSMREALPGSMMESCLYGRPCFMYPCEGAEDIFGPYQADCVSRDFKSGLLADLIDHMLRDDSHLERTTRGLQQRATTLFSRQAHLHQLHDLLQWQDGDAGQRPA